MSLLFAATYPDRVSALALFGTLASKDIGLGLATPEYRPCSPAAPPGATAAAAAVMAASLLRTFLTRPPDLVLLHVRPSRRVGHGAPPARRCQLRDVDHVAAVLALVGLVYVAARTLVGTNPRPATRSTRPPVPARRAGNWTRAPTLRMGSRTSHALRVWQPKAVKPHRDAGPGLQEPVRHAGRLRIESPRSSRKHWKIPSLARA